ncbi:hypothetical protein A1O3_00687 [Capronia epimyces CBS 606.96]|uniref:Cytochrome P450 monooxygenase ABA1 n=1 Tax=Capronia epimyces CBS 606.96 TaxID=1182542 RepID=W9YGW2_9EURO|nr:uncharacterized protein A1O3_00687 [Capronia epimyces CBS 606.96]EXJ92137.1 hypothetical protein A1O3_00687 [Capronia epimyces CBS 606.96]
MLSILLAGALLFLYLLLTSLYSWYRLRHIPGPFWAGISKLWLFKHTWDGSMYLTSAEACFKHGSLIRIGPNELITSDPNVLRYILSVRSPYHRADWYEAIRIDPDHDNVLSERDEERHAMLRTKMSPGYAGKDVPNLEESLDNVIHKLVSLIETNYLSTDTEYRPIDFARKAQYLTLDIIGDIGFGRAFGYLDEDKDMFSYISTTEATIPMIILVGAFPWLAKVVQSPLLKAFLPKDTDAYGLGKIMGLAKQVVTERFQPDAKPHMDMLGSFIRHGLSQEDAESETMVQILAGSDTTASATRATMLHLITNPRVLSKLLAELKANQISDPITDSEARRLPYLQAVIKEGLRIHPPVTGLMLKDVPPTGDTINGYFVPGGTKLGYCAFGLFWDPKLWGSDARVFRPERWLEGSPEEIRQKEANLELVFGHGRWQCLGKSIAQIELNKIFVQLLRNFEFSIVDPTKPWNSFNAGVFIVSDMWMRVTKRDPKI